MKNYLIDTNICIYYIKGKFDLKKKFEKVNPDNCFISEITLAELKFGVENSEKKEKNQNSPERVYLANLCICQVGPPPI